MTTKRPMSHQAAARAATAATGNRSAQRIGPCDDSARRLRGTALSSSRDVGREAMDAVRRVRQPKGSRSVEAMKMMQWSMPAADVEPASRRDRLGDPGLGIAHRNFEALAFGKTGGDRR